MHTYPTLQHTLYRSAQKCGGKSKTFFIVKLKFLWSPHVKCGGKCPHCPQHLWTHVHTLTYTIHDLEYIRKINMCTLIHEYLLCKHVCLLMWKTIRNVHCGCRGLTNPFTPYKQSGYEVVMTSIHRQHLVTVLMSKHIVYHVGL